MSATLVETAPLAAPAAAPASRADTAARVRWAGRILSGIAVLFLAFDLAYKLVASATAAEGSATLGWATHQMPTLAIIELACLILYLVPRTAPLGAVLWTGYFGGAIATHLRVESPLLTHTLFPIYVAALVWGGLYLRDARVRALLRAVR